MPNELDPIVGQWYLHRDKGEMFRVVAADAAGGYVEIQYFDGDLEELEVDAWREMDIETAAEPEDWTGPFDEVEPAELGFTDTSMSPQDWRSSLESLHAAEESSQDTRAADEIEDEEEGRPPERYVEEEQEAIQDRAH